MSTVGGHDVWETFIPVSLVIAHRLPQHLIQGPVESFKNSVHLRFVWSCSQLIDIHPCHYLLEQSFFETWSHIRQQLPWGTQCLENMCHKRSRYRGCSLYFGRGMESAHFEKCSSNVMLYWFERAECGCVPIKSMDTRSHASSTKGDHFTKL